MAEDIVFYQHPDYKRAFKDWTLFRKLYGGTHDELTAPDILWKHEFEEYKDGAKLYTIRQQRSRYINFVKSFIESYVSLVLKNEIDTSEIRDIIDENEEKDVDGKGTSLRAFTAQQIARPYFQFGKAVTLVDNYPGEAPNYKIEKESGIRPYMQGISPLDMLDWGLETAAPKYKGQLRFVRVESDILEDRQDATDKPHEFRYSTVYRVDYSTGRPIITVQRYRGYELKDTVFDAEKNKWTPEDPMILNIGRCPIATVSRNSWLEQIAPIALLRHNTQSALDNILLFQAHRQIFVYGDFGNDTDLVLHEGAVTFFKEGENVLALEPVAPVSLEKREDVLTRAMIQVAYSLTRVTPSDSRETESADAQREQKESFKAQLVQAGIEIQACLNQTIKNWAAFKGQPDYKGEAILNLDIQDEDIDMFIRLAQARADEIARHREWQKAVNKKWAHLMGTDASEVVTEIDSDQGPETPEMIAYNRREFLRTAIGA